MKRVPVLLPVALLLSLFLLFGATPVAADEPSVVTADYVLGLLEAGMDQDEIIERIIDKDLTFDLREGDITRLREAGAGKDLIRVVTRREFDDQEYGAVAPYGGYVYPGYAVSPWFYGYYSFYYPYYYPRYVYRAYPYYTYYGHHRHHTIGPRGGTRPRVLPRGSSPGAPSPGRGGARRPPRGSH
jgi:hypothetical protein